MNLWRVMQGSGKADLSILLLLSWSWVQQFTQNAGTHLPDNAAGNFILHSHFKYSSFCLTVNNAKTHLIISDS
jgi:hypothetical protein